MGMDEPERGVMRKHTKKSVKREKKSPLLLRLYVADTTPRSQLAMTNLRKLCAHYLESGCRVQIVDIVRDPESAFQNDILATPTLVRVHPTPQKAVVGSLSDATSVLKALDLFQDKIESQSLTFLQSAGQA
jgi:circadian clock protein KaiB